MSPSNAEVIRNIREQVVEVDPSDVQRQLGNGAVVVDIREAEELESGRLPGSVHVPKSYLETRIENEVPDHDAHVILYCA
jgi:rhodanese-related sulfurtransferase